MSATPLNAILLSATPLNEILLNYIFFEYVNGRNKTNIKNRSYHLYRNLIDLKDFDAVFLKIDKKSTKTLMFITLDTAHL